MPGMLSAECLCLCMEKGVFTREGGLTVLNKDTFYTLCQGRSVDIDDELTFCLLNFC